MKPKQSKKTSSKQTLINFVLDETGSMCVCKEATISGFNEYINSLRKRKEKILFTLTKFDSEKIEVVHDGIDIKKVENLNEDTYIPGAMTPLYDAIATTIKKTEKKQGKKKMSVLCVIMTDGEENASKEYTRDKIFKLIKKKVKDKWTFVFLGANQDAWATGQAIGLHRGNVMNYKVTQTKAAYGNLAAQTCSFLSSGSKQSIDFCVDKSNKDKKIKKGEVKC